MRPAPNASRLLEDHLLRALNKIKKPSTSEEIAELLNRDLGPGDRAFQAKEIEAYLRNSDRVLTLFWLEYRPRH
jgi:hypothetical protein